MVDGDILLLASQKFVRQVADSDNIAKVYDALETLIFGEVTQTSLLRTVNDQGDTYALAFQKGKLRCT